MIQHDKLLALLTCSIACQFNLPLCRLAPTLRKAVSDNSRLCFPGDCSMLTTNTWHLAQHLKFLQLSHSPPRDLGPAPQTKQTERHRSNGPNMGPAGQLLWLVSCERMSLQSRQHLTRWCGEPHWAEVAGSPSSCLAAHQQHHCPTCGVS